MAKPFSIKSATLWVFITLFLPISARAQWNDDPMQNSGIGVAAGDQALPKIVETSDGGCFVSWFDNRSGSYCVYMQRLNALGENLWAANGMLISAHPQMTWLVDYDLTVDQDDNAIVVFADIRSGGSNDLDIFAYKIGSDGSFLWGPDGIGLSETVNTNFEPAPKVTVTSDGNVVVGWQKSGASDILCFQKISSAGSKMWGPDGIDFLPVGSESLGAPDLVQADQDEVIALWKSSTGPPWAPITHLYTQRFDTNGNPLWGSPGVLIYDLGAITAWTYPTIHADHNDGAFYTWYDAPSLSEFNVWVQHVDSNGKLVFPMNGVKASTNSSDRLHMYPSLCHLPASDELYVFWVEENWAQSQYGVYGQKFSPQGDRLWTDNGKEYIGLGDDQISFVRCAAGDKSIYVGYFEDPATLNSAVKAFRIEPDGTLIWSSKLLSSSTLGGKDDLEMVVNNENRAFFTWCDKRIDNGDIYAQNVNIDGSLGNPLTVAPDTISTLTGGSADFTLDAGTNQAGRSYMLLGTVSGRTPGVPLPKNGEILPIEWDIFTNIVIVNVNTPALSNFLGSLDPVGQAAAQLNMGPVDPGVAGLVMTFAFLLQGTPDWDYVSNGADITLTL